MEASALRHGPRARGLTCLSPHLRLQSDERLVALIRRGHHGAFEALVKRYYPRLLAFCRHMLGSTEDAEDVLQEVLASAFRAICADERPISARPWLYRIARNRCLNHLRRPEDPAGRDSMDFFEREQGTTTADTVHRREELRHIVADVQDLPETQRTALVLREMDALSYEQIAQAMETTVPSVKSLLVRARVALVEASESRRLSCAEVRLELAQSADGMGRASAPARRHVKSCPGCRTFRRDLRRTGRALAAVYPLGPVVAMKKVLAVKLSSGSAATGTAVGEGALGGSAVAGGSGAGGSAVAGGATALGGGGAAGMLSAGAGSLAVKATAGLMAAALVTAGAAEVRGNKPIGEPAGGAAPAAEARHGHSRPSASRGAQAREVPSPGVASRPRAPDGSPAVADPAPAATLPAEPVSTPAASAPPDVRGPGAASDTDAGELSSHDGSPRPEAQAAEPGHGGEAPTAPPGQVPATEEGTSEAGSGTQPLRGGSAPGPADGAAARPAPRSESASVPRDGDGAPAPAGG